MFGFIILLHFFYLADLLSISQMGCEGTFQLLYSYVAPLLSLSPHAEDSATHSVNLHWQYYDHINTILQFKELSAFGVTVS